MSFQQRAEANPTNQSQSTSQPIPIKPNKRNKPNEPDKPDKPLQFRQ